MSYTVGQAATATGKSKSTISRAIENGRISAIKREDGSYIIEPVELHRVFQPQSRATVAPVSNDALRDSNATAPDLLEVRVLEARLEGLQQQLRTVEEHNRELNARLDQSAEQQMRLTLMLTDRSAPKSTGLLKRLFGVPTRK